MADATPKTRDRYVDLLRAFSIFVVVFGHWLMAIVYFEDGRLSGESALDAVPGMWLATWVLQVMPLFFFVGGFSHFVAWRSVRRDKGSFSDFLRSRTQRLLRPTLIFISAWTAVALVGAVALPGSFEAMSRATELLAKPLWFLAVYVLVVALAPLMLSVHDRFGARALVGLGGAAVLVDVVRIGFDITAVGYLNFAFVWLFAHQLGFFYADGTLAALRRKVFGLVALGALATLVALTASGIYSPSMVGMVSERASNNSPPSICLIVLTLWLVGIAMLLRPALTRRLESRSTWTLVVAANSMIMTVFLWHLTALLVAVLVAFPLGFPQPRGGTAAWWLLRPVWLVILTGLLSGFVVAFSRFERPRSQRGKGRRTHVVAVGLGVGALVAGLAGFALFGFAMPGIRDASLLAQPLVNLALVFVGYRTLCSRGASPAS
jgi:fucose 4-O-acetylase-like acetyltransferase